MRAGSMRRLLALVVFFSTAPPASLLVAQIQEPFATWNRCLAERSFSVPEATRWLQKAVKPLGDQAVARLRHYLEAPLLAPYTRHRLAAAMALRAYGIHHLERALKIPTADVRSAAALALFAPISGSGIPWPVTRQTAPGAFDAVPYTPDSPVTDFLEGLTSQDTTIRTFSLAVLMGYRPEGDATFQHERNTALLKALDSKDARVRAGAAHGLGWGIYRGRKECQRVFERLEKARTDPDPEVRAAVVEAFQRVPWPDSDKARIFAAALEDSDDRVVTAAAEGVADLSQFGAPALPALVRAAGKNHAPYARAAILGAMTWSGRGDKTVVNVAFATLKAPEPEVRRAALWVLAQSGDHSDPVIEAVRAAAKDVHPFVRSSAIVALRILQDTTPEGIQLVVAATEDPSCMVRLCAFSALHRLMRDDPVRAAACYARGLTDPAYSVRNEAVRGLGRIGPAARDHAGPAIELLEDPDVSNAARIALRTLGVNALPALIERLKSGKAAARFEVVGLVGRLGKPALVPLMVLLDHEHEAVQGAAASALAWMGPVARPAEAQLLRLAASGPTALRPISAWALYRINTKGFPSPELLAAALQHRGCTWALIQATRFQGRVSPAVAAVLESVLQGKDTPLAKAAAGALAVCRVEPQKSTPLFADPSNPDPALIEQARSGSTPERLAAVRTLLCRGPKSAMAAPDLIQRLYDIELAGAPPPPGKRQWWNLPEIMGTGTALSPEAMQDAGRRVALALAAYPLPLVRTHLQKVMLLRTLQIYGTAYGGTFRGATLYLAAGQRPDRHLVAALHHEFSSLLLGAGSFPKEAWRAIHPPTFRYGHGGLSAILRGAVGEGSADLHAQGFFKPYGRADLENDVNVFAETVMTYPVWAAEIIHQHPRLAAKHRLWQQHLASLVSPPEPAR